ncbi:hypothetical protein CLV37_102348 [Kineococcus rhizosphaerae]|uniref:Luciferase-like monooxygenase n=1 Tax=Kineococcus rhizosphaerae TaxID=559628 RepID=A0A2T0R8A7_9ACTN|nr:hypothetical protein CLV37_102348 [Kineococcus rhizosphaerae]
MIALDAQWMPVPEAPGLLGRWRRSCERAGRQVPLTIGAAPADAAVLAGFRDAGVHRCVVWLDHDADGPDPEEALDRLVRVRDRL